MNKKVISNLVLAVAVVVFGQGGVGYAQVPAAAKLDVAGVAKLVEGGKLRALTNAYGLSGNSSVVAAELAKVLEADLAAGGTKAGLANDVLTQVINPSLQKGEVNGWGVSKAEALAAKVARTRSGAAGQVEGAAKAEAVVNRATVGSRAAVSPAALGNSFLSEKVIDLARYNQFVENVQDVPAALIVGEKGLECPTDWESRNTKLALLEAVETVAVDAGRALRGGARESEVPVCKLWANAISKVVKVPVEQAVSRVATLAGPECRLAPRVCATN